MTSQVFLKLICELDVIGWRGRRTNRSSTDYWL